MKQFFATKKFIIAVLLLLALLGAFVFERNTGNTRSTENAYIEANVVSVASQVAGRVTHVYIRKNQLVHKGDALFGIDPEPYNIALAHAQADIA